MTNDLYSQTLIQCENYKNAAAKNERESEGAKPLKFHRGKFGRKANLYELLHFYELSWILSIVNYFLARSSFLSHIPTDIDQRFPLNLLSQS